MKYCQQSVTKNDDRISAIRSTKHPHMIANKSRRRMGTRRTGPGIVSSGSGTSISTMSFGRSNAGVLKDRANMSFMLVVMFFAVFGVIVLTEIFLIDEKRGNGGTGAFGGHRSGHRLTSALDRPDYEEVIADDYATLKGGFDAQIGLLLMNSNAESKAIEAIPSDPRSLSSLPPSVELKLPVLDQNLPMTDAEWLPVTNTRYKFFVYSAYYDDRAISSRSGNGLNSNSRQTSKQKGKSSINKSSGLIRIIGATKTRTPDGVWCRLWYRVERNTTNITASVTVAAKIKVIRENWNLKYSACFVICQLPPVSPIQSPDPKVTLTPEAVSVVAKLRTLPTNRIFIQNRPKDRPTKKDELAICVKPLHYDYNRVLQLIEFIELHRLLGVSHFTLYNDTIGTEAGCALKYYQNQGIVNFLPWHHLDMISQREIRTENLFAALNDCLYRSMYKYEYIALLDLDEFIIPRHNDTIPQLIRWIASRVNPKTSSAFSFQNAFFYLQWPDDPWVTVSKTPTEAGLITLRKTRRKSKLHPHKQRSKYVCKPRDIVEAGNHFVWEFLAGHGTLNVPADAAILHHYRVCEFGGDDCVKTPSIIDRTAYKYRDKLADAVDKVWMELDENCVLPELEAVPELSPLVPSSPDDVQTR